jgi:hypothetical protein
MIEGSESYVCKIDMWNFQAKKCPLYEDGFLVERRGYSPYLGCLSIILNMNIQNN